MKEQIYQYYAFAVNKAGQLEQLFITRTTHPLTQRWTGKIYKSIKEANQDMIRLNCQD